MRQSVELYQQRFRPRRVAWPIQRFALLGLLVLLGGSGWYVVELDNTRVLEASVQQFSEQVAHWNARLSQLDTQFAKIDTPDQVQRVRRLRDELRANRELTRYLNALVPRHGPRFSEYLDALSRRHRKGLWLTDIRILAGGRKLHFGGSALQARKVPEFLHALSSETAYAGRTFSSLVVNRPPEDDWKIDFQLRTVRETGS